MEKTETLKDYTKIVVETDEKNPITIVTITNGETVVAESLHYVIQPQLSFSVSAVPQFCSSSCE